jgi:hypothetical protein
MAICIINFARIRQTLRVTPAMEAGIDVRVILPPLFGRGTFPHEEKEGPHLPRVVK